MEQKSEQDGIYAHLTQESKKSEITQIQIVHETITLKPTLPRWKVIASFKPRTKTLVSANLGLVIQIIFYRTEK